MKCDGKTKQNPNLQHQRKRIRVMSDEGSDNEELAAGIDGKQAIKETLFDDDDDMAEDLSSTPARERDTEDKNEFGDLDEEEESGGCGVVGQCHVLYAYLCRGAYVYTGVCVCAQECVCLVVSKCTCVYSWLCVCFIFIHGWVVVLCQCHMRYAYSRRCVCAQGCWALKCVCAQVCVCA